MNGNWILLSTLILGALLCYIGLELLYEAIPNIIKWRRRSIKAGGMLLGYVSALILTFFGLAAYFFGAIFILSSALELLVLHGFF